MLRRLPTSAGVSSAFYGAIMSLKTLNILAEVVCGSHPPVPFGNYPPLALRALRALRARQTYTRLTACGVGGRLETSLRLKWN